MDSRNLPQTLLLCLAFREPLDSTYSPLFKRLAEATRIKRARTATAALRYLEYNTPKTILITDEGLVEQANAEVLRKVVSYIHNGGLAIFGCHFPTYVGRDAFESFFASTFQLPWRRGVCYRTEYQLNTTCVLPAPSTTVPLPGGPHCMQALHISNARPHQRIFVPIPNAVIHGHIEGPQPADPTLAAVAGAKVGNGYLAYCGDVLGEQCTKKIILSLCGISEEPII